MLRTVLCLSALCALALANGGDPNTGSPPESPPDPPSSGISKKKLMANVDSKANVHSKKEIEKNLQEVLKVLKNRKGIEQKVERLNELKKTFGTNEDDGNLVKKSCGDLDNVFEILFNVFVVNWLHEELLYFDYVYYYIGYGSGLRWSMYHSLNVFDYAVSVNENRTATCT